MYVMYALVDRALAHDNLVTLRSYYMKGTLGLALASRAMLPATYTIFEAYHSIPCVLR